MAESKRPRVMVDMSATLIHHGHIRLLKKAAEIGEVVVALTSDDEVKKTKGYVPELNFAERKEILESIKYVSEVVSCPWLITEDFMKSQHCDLLVHGADNSNHIPAEKLINLRECQDFCVWGGYSRGSPTRLPFVFEMQYARPDAIAGAKVEGARAERGRILLSPRYRAPRSGWRVSARGLIISLPYSMAPVKRSPNSRANWGMAAAHLGVARFQEAVKFMMAR